MDGGRRRGEQSGRQVKEEARREVGSKDRGTQAGIVAGRQVRRQGMR